MQRTLWRLQRASCRAELVRGFISWGEWKTQHNASLSSEHFAGTLNMWPWFRWMSTCYLDSNNLQLLADKCMHNCAHSLPHYFALPPLLAQPTVLIMSPRPASQGRAARDTSGTGGSTPTTSMLTTRQSQSRWSWFWLRDWGGIRQRSSTTPHAGNLKKPATDTVTHCQSSVWREGDGVQWYTNCSGPFYHFSSPIHK